MSFHKNECYQKNCKQTFHTLSDLITHIEKDHLGFSRNKLDQLEKEPPDCIPMSYVLRFSKTDDPTPQSIESSQTFLPQIARKKPSVVVRKNKEVIPTLREVVESMNNNYLACNFDIEYNSMTSEIRVKQEEMPKEVSQLLRQKLFSMDDNYKKPFGCNMPGCHKRYKNINGIKYHYKTHHKLHIPVFKKSVLKYKPTTPQPSQPTNNNNNKIKIERPAGAFKKNCSNENILLPLQIHQQSNGKTVDQFYTRTPPNKMPLTAITNNTNCVLNNCFSYGSDVEEQFSDNNCFSFSFSDFED